MEHIYQVKYNGKIQRLIKSAKLRFLQAKQQEIIYASRGLNTELIKNLFTGQYIGLHLSTILQGFTGSGKPYLACVLKKEACLHHVRMRYIRLPDLLMEYEGSAVVARNHRNVLERYSRIPLLILDERLVSDISDAELHFLFELISQG